MALRVPLLSRGRYCLSLHAVVAGQGRNARLHVFEADIRVHVGRGGGAGVAQLLLDLPEVPGLPQQVNGQPIRRDPAELLQSWLTGKKPTEPVFNMPDKVFKFFSRFLRKFLPLL